MRDELQWLSIGERIRFKLSILVHKLPEQRTTLLGRQDQAAIKWLQQVAAAVIKLVWCFRCLHGTKTEIGNRAFQVASPRRTWNGFLQLFGKPKPFLLSKSSWNCTWSAIPSVSLDIALTVNILVNHPSSGVPSTVLYNLSYLRFLASGYIKMFIDVVRSF